MTCDELIQAAKNAGWRILESHYPSTKTFVKNKDAIDLYLGLSASRWRLNSKGNWKKTWDRKLANITPDQLDKLLK